MWKITYEIYILNMVIKYGQLNKKYEMGTCQIWQIIYAPIVSSFLWSFY